MKSFLVKSTGDEESMEFFVDGDSVGKVNYETHGTAGMNAAYNVFFNIASKYNIVVDNQFSEY